MLHLWVATSNQGKLAEFKSLMPGVQIHSPAELAVFSYPKETGKTFLDNARIKARSLKSLKSDQWVIGEDSGLEVEGLQGLPGIFSARYAGEKASDAENNAKLLKMMQIRSAQNRNALFRCTMVMFSPSGQEFVIDGVLKGQIANNVQGKGGFGYDPVFIPENESQTLAELGPGKKNLISHRAQALKKVMEVLKAESL